jgi:hypothetical protein
MILNAEVNQTKTCHSNFGRRNVFLSCHTFKDVFIENQAYRRIYIQEGIFFTGSNSVPFCSYKSARVPI